MIDILLAVGLDLILGDPPKFPHPIKLMGSLIAVEEKLIRKCVQRLAGYHLEGGVHLTSQTDRDQRLYGQHLEGGVHLTSQTNSHRFQSGAYLLLAGGFFLVVINLCLAFFMPYLLLKQLHPYPYLYHLINIYLLYTCLAARCLRDEALNVYQALKRGLEEARYKLSFIVGRETNHLDEPEIIRATVETVAENTADGVIAPLFFALIGGAPLALMYKMLNTMDSMLGYTNEKYRYIGYFPAKLDDVFNYLPARLTGILMNIGSLFKYCVLSGFTIMLRDRNNHRSPNCAYPEGAMAGLLGIQLGGDNVYFRQIVKKPTIGDRKRSLERQDIPRSIEVMFRAEFVLLLAYMLIWLL